MRQLLLALLALAVLGFGMLTHVRDARVQTRVDAMRNDLHNLAAAQELYLDDAPRYATTPGELAGFRLTDGVELLRLEGDARRWMAVVGHEDLDRLCLLERGQLPGPTRVIACHERSDPGDPARLGRIEVTDATPAAGEGVVLDATDALDLPDDLIDRLRWSFGDGEVRAMDGGDLLVVRHTFERSGPPSAVVLTGWLAYGPVRYAAVRIRVGD